MAVLALLFALAGCGDLVTPQTQVQTPPPVAPATQPTADYLRHTAVQGEGMAEGTSAVDSALALSERYSQAVEKLTVLQTENKTLIERNSQLVGQTTKLQAELAQTQKELEDANAMLVDIRKELEKWKTDVLGFRQEMRQAQQTQIEATGKVLKMLGGDAPTLPPVATRPAVAPTATPVAPAVSAEAPAPTGEAAPAEAAPAAPAAKEHASE
jgi:predicted small lipoprotein YifL